jgi:hypothetical protein
VIFFALLCFALCFLSFCCFFSFFFSSGIFLLPTYGLLGFNFLEEKHTNCAHCVGLCVCVCVCVCVFLSVFCKLFQVKKAHVQAQNCWRTISMSFLLTKFYAQLGLIFKIWIWTGILFFNLRTRSGPGFSIPVNMCWIYFSSVNLTTFAN